MTQVSFHFNVPDTLGYACRLLRKAVAAGARVTVCAPEPVLRQLDVMLWTFSPQDFVAHCKDDASEAMCEASPVLLCQAIGAAHVRPVLLNLQPGVPEQAGQFSRVIELVGTDEADKQAARQRWKHHAGAGHAIERHDVAQRPETR